MRKLAILAATGAFLVPMAVLVPQASATGNCHDSFGNDFAFAHPQSDRNGNGIICSKPVGNQGKAVYTDDYQAKRRDFRQILLVGRYLNPPAALDALLARHRNA